MTLMVARYRLSAVGRLSFPDAGPRIWNQLSTDDNLAHQLKKFGLV
jgi:hypothetical protein